MFASRRSEGTGCRSRAASIVKTTSRAVVGDPRATASVGVQVQRELVPAAVPVPPRREVRLWDERAVVARERDEQRESLDLTRQRMDGDERVRRLEIGARRIDDRVARA